MTKKIFLVVILLFIAGVGFCFAPKKNLTPSDYQIGMPYEQAIKEDKPIIGLFYVDWCTYCRNFMPKLRLLDMIYKNKYNVVMINCEDKGNKNLVEDYQIGSYPTIYIIDYKLDNRVHIDNEYYDSLTLLKREFDRYLRIKSILK